MNLLKKIGDLLPWSEPPASPAKRDTESADNGARMFVRRRQRLSEGFITSDHISTPRPCTLRDMTVLGGRVDLWDEVRPRQLMSGLKLYLANDRTEVECEVKWIRGKSLGLEFKCKPYPAPIGRYR